MIRRGILKLVCTTGFALAVTATNAPAVNVSWDIDPSQSFVRLLVPDQNLSFDTGSGSITANVRLRNQDSNAWTDAGGRRAFVDGTISTDYFDGTSIKFNTGLHNIFALEQASVRPNPTQFTGPSDAANPDGTYVGSGTATAAYGARVRANAILTFDVAYMAIREVQYNISSGVIPLTSGGTTFAGNTSNFGISSASMDVDGLFIGFPVSQQPVPDMRDESLSPIGGTDTLGGVIANLGGNSRRLTYSISMPVTIVVDSTVQLSGTAEGTIVAFATVPEPGTFVLAGMGLMALVGWQIRRRRAA